MAISKAKLKLMHR